MKFDMTTNIDTLIKAGWILSVSCRFDGSLVATIHDEVSGQAHNYPGETIKVVLDGLERYLNQFKVGESLNAPRAGIEQSGGLSGQ